MASINGITIKNITHFLGHEGEPLFQGDLYLEGKKIGFWSQDSWGGPDRFLMEAPYSERLLNNLVVEKNPHKAYEIGSPDDPIKMEYSLDIMLSDCLGLIEDEKAYKEAVKKGYSGIMIATDGYHQTTWQLPKPYTDLSNEDLLKRMGTQLEFAKESFWKENDHTKHEVMIYRSPKDFVVGAPIQLADISKKKGLNERLADANRAEEKKEKSTSEVQINKENEPER